MENNNFKGAQIEMLNEEEFDQEISFIVSEKLTINKRVTFKRDYVINSLIDKIKDLEKKINGISEIQIINDAEAEIRVKDLVNRFKSQDKKEIDMVDIVNELNLPLDQIEKIMLKLEKEMVVLQNE
ncbi:MAG: hypothetical protein KKB29_00060 [Nanoarchaeota archaeon]|nr:hypothetical protein [Nanoarchaeota archaeon]